MEASFSELISRNKLSTILMPLCCEKRKYFNELIKFTPILKYNTKFVTTGEEMPGIINYDKLMGYNDKDDNSNFIIDNVELFIYYASDVLLKTNNNKFIILIDATEIKSLYNLRTLKNFDKYHNLITFFPKNFDYEIDMSFNERKTFIFDKQLKKYREEYLKYMNLSYDVYSEQNEIKEVLGYLNVFTEEKNVSLETMTLDKALTKAPKFKTIITDILLRNKKRHLVKMMDGKYGINSFQVIYDKINNILPIVIIRSTDNYNDKIKKLKDFNESNAPAVLLTDFNFGQKLVPANIDYYHVTNGGDYNDIISMMTMLKTPYYSGSYPRKFNIISHVSVTTGLEKTLDEKNNDEFSNKFNSLLTAYNQIKNVSNQIYLKGEEFFVTLPDQK